MTETVVTETVGMVAIGRNEGERLRRCLASSIGRVGRIVYVDSGSSDGSAAMAREMGVEVVDLDLSTPFTAARARNAGIARLLEVSPGCEFIQLIDGDCEIVDGWAEKAHLFLRENEKFAIAAGRVRERQPDASIYNRLCDVEWQTPAGETHWCGGNVMIRAAAFAEVGGFDPALIAGEEPELCVRLRAKGWKIYRLDADVAIHDADMHHFGQWWRRMVRTGHAFAEGAAMHGSGPQKYCVAEVQSNWFWGVAVPAVALGAAWPTRGWSLLLLVGYVALAAKIFVRARRAGLGGGDAAAFSAFTVVGKFAQAIGQMKFLLGRISGRRNALMEYKR